MFSIFNFINWWSELNVATFDSGHTWNVFLTYFSGGPPFRKTTQKSWFKHSFRCFVFCMMLAWGSNLCFKALTSIFPVFKCFSGICFGAPILPLRKIDGLLLKSNSNRSAIVFPLGKTCVQSTNTNSALMEPSPFASWKTLLIGKDLPLGPEEGGVWQSAA